jgi:preflagellin peptidase FlaK
MDDPSLYFNVLRLIVGSLILLYASYTDIKTRTAPNILWIIISLIGCLFLIFEYFIIGIEELFYLIFIPFMIIIFYILFQLLPFFGGADVKALMSFAILVPFEPVILFFPIYGSIMPFSWIIFSNSVFIYIIIPFSLFFYNLLKGDLKFPYCVLGYRIELDKAKEKFVWPLEKIIDGKRKISYFSMNKNNNDIYSAFEELRINKIWVTPKIPFMIPLLIGFILSFFVGDILFFIMSMIF